MLEVATESLYAGGRWSAASGGAIDVINPAHASVLASVPSASANDVRTALEAAARAQTDWAHSSPRLRAGHLQAMADIIAAHGSQLADTIVLEVGKPAEQAAVEVEFAEAFLRYSAEWDRRLEGEILPGDVSGEVIHLLRGPIGVVAAICPWNFPLAVLCRKLGPALITGNTVVIKPSEVSPLSTLLFMRLIDEQLDLPAGVLNLVTGSAETGEALVSSDLTSMVSFTGHRDTGKAVMALASRNLTRVSLELGGKAPAIVWQDADLDLAIPAIVAARHTNCGQVCTSAERVIVHNELLESFTERYVSAVETMTIGDPIGAVDMGPMASAAQLKKTTAAITTAVDEGATVISGGSRPSGDEFAEGYWLMPTVLRDVTPKMRVMTDETFGPVTPIMGTNSIKDAIAIANDSRYGLSAYVFSRDYPTVMRTVDDLQFGEIYVNRSLGESVHAHHAGFKESGIGGEDGKWGLLRYTQIKTVYHHYG